MIYKLVKFPSLFPRQGPVEAWRTERLFTLKGKMKMDEQRGQKSECELRANARKILSLFYLYHNYHSVVFNIRLRWGHKLHSHNLITAYSSSSSSSSTMSIIKRPDEQWIEGQKCILAYLQNTSVLPIFLNTCLDTYIHNM